MPGGLNDMTILGGAMGGEERSIALAHALRILTVVHDDSRSGTGW